MRMFFTKILAMMSFAPHLALAAGADFNGIRCNANEVSATEGSDFSIEMMCGPNCLWQIGRAFGKTHSLGAIAHMAGTRPPTGTTVAGMLEAAEKMGLPAVAVKTNIRTLSKDARVAILLLTLKAGNHYVILDTIEDGEVRLLDGAKFRNLSTDQLTSVWKGYAILVGGEKGRTHNDMKGPTTAILKAAAVVVFSLVLAYYVRCGQRST